MEQYIDCVLRPFDAELHGAPDVFPRRTCTTRINGSFSIASSLANGHVLARIQPMYVLSSAGAVLTYYTDGANPVYVSLLPTIANMTANVIAGSSALITLGSLYRLVGFEYRLKYVGAELTQAGELAIGYDHANTIVVGYDVKSLVRDCAFNTRGPSDAQFRGIVIPQDDADFIMRGQTAVAAAKDQYWHSITICGTGFPPGIVVYDVEWCAIVEFLVSPIQTDFIPRSMSWTASREDAMVRIKQKVMAFPTCVLSNSHEYHQAMRAAERMIADPVDLTKPTVPGSG